MATTARKKAKKKTTKKAEPKPDVIFLSSRWGDGLMCVREGAETDITKANMKSINVGCSIPSDIIKSLGGGVWKIQVTKSPKARNDY